MSYEIEQKFNGRQLTGFDSSEVELWDLSSKNKSFSICASSSKPDRFLDEVIQEGLIWSNWWPRNPIFPFAHQYNQLPVAKGILEAWIEKDGEYSKTFVRGQMGSHRDAEQIWTAMQGGLIRSASIGFVPKKSSPIKIDPKSEDQPPMFHTPQRYHRAEILEVSLVTVWTWNHSTDCVIHCLFWAFCWLRFMLPFFKKNKSSWGVVVLQKGEGFPSFPFARCMP